MTTRRRAPEVVLLGAPPTEGGQQRADVLAGAAPDRARRRWPVVVVATSLALGIGGVRADAALAEREVDELLGRVGAGLSTVAYTERRVQGIVRYFSPAVVSPGVEARVRDSLQGIVREEAAGQVAAVQRHRAAAVQVRLLPWHTAERRARDRWVAYLDACIAYLEAVSRQFRRLYQPRPEQEVALAAAREAFEDASAAGSRAAVVFDR